MIRGQKLKRFFYSSWFLAVIPSLAVILFLPDTARKHTLEVEEHFENGGIYSYADLDSDSISEQIAAIKTTPYSFVNIWNSDHQIYDQWNLKDSLNPAISKLFFGDYDNDNFGEVYIFTYQSDSLFLNINEVLQPSGTRINRLFITSIGYLNGLPAATVMPAGFFDADGDQRKELYFSISSYYQLGTRRVYYYDIERKVLTSSDFYGNICLDPELYDIDGDGYPEIFGNLSSSGNYSTRVPYSDSSAWLMVFDHRLKLKFPPVEFPGFANGLKTFPFKSDSLSGYLLSYEVNAADFEEMESSIMIYSKDGKYITGRPHSDFKKKGNVIVCTGRSVPADRIYIIGDKLFEVNRLLKEVKKTDLPFQTGNNAYYADITGDGIDEFLFYSAEEKRIAVYNDELIKLLEQPFYAPETEWRFSPYLSKDHKYKLFLAAGSEGYLLTIRRNSFYLLSYLIFPGIYLPILLFILLVKKINTYQLKVKDDLNQRLLKLQLQGIKAQLDPHFTFNTLNSIASLIYLEDRETAYDYMRKFTELLRSMLNDAERIYRNLGEELEFVKTYLELEKLRFGKKFCYSINIGEAVSMKEQVPKLVLQTFAENAVKHGVMPADTGGMISISVSREKDRLKLVIEDNGVGRQRSAGHSTSTGKGLKLTREFYDILNQINKRPIIHQITDLYDDSSNPAGTRVEVWVPVG